MSAVDTMLNTDTFGTKAYNNTNRAMFNVLIFTVKNSKTNGQADLFDGWF